jgi:hypothetical protein
MFTPLGADGGMFTVFALYGVYIFIFISQNCRKYEKEKRK